VGRAFSPLDEELGLVGGSLTPRLAESVTRLGTWLPFRRAVAELAHLTGARVSEATARRLTERAGAAYVAVQASEVTRLERETPEAPAGADLQLLSVDGAMVPLRGKEWTEVKTLALGVVKEETNSKGERVIRATELSYFSRCSEASEFTRQALVETQRRGLERARQVCAVGDGAEWVQGFVAYHRPDAIRILDFAHAAERLAEAGRVAFGDSSAQFQPWLAAQCHQLKTGRPDEVLAALGALPADSEAARVSLSEQVQYLTKRRAMIRYQEFQALGYPIGSGSVESANKLVVEARLKQAGMHWARSSVNPLVALRNVACNDRWAEAWPQIASQQQKERTQTKLGRHPRPAAPMAPATTPAKRIALEPELAPPVPKKEPKPKYRPPADHPWRRFKLGRKFQPPDKAGHSAKS
jgi:hypothetical protein